MIIAAYAGCGKTYMAKKYPAEYIEVVSMPYARILPITEEKTKNSFEYEKAASYHINNPIFPYNMIPEILEAERNSKFVIIPTINSVIRLLQNEYGRNVILCYPEDDIEETYRKRYMERGNSEEFCKIFVEGMKDFLDSLKENHDAFHITLAQGEYLSDKQKVFDEIYSEFPTKCVESNVIDELKQKIHEKRNDIWLDISLFMDHVYYNVEDIENIEERQFVYDLGKRLMKSGDCGYILSYDFDITKEVEKLHLIPKTVNKKGLIAALEKHEKMIGRFCKD